MTKFIIIVIIIIKHIIRKYVIMMEGCYALCLFRYPAGNYMFRVNNRRTIVNFEQVNTDWVIDLTKK